MKNSTKRSVLMTSVVMLLVAVMSLTTATYAWFVSNTSGSLEGIEMSTTAGSGILFSANGTDWTNTLTYQNFVDANNNGNNFPGNSMAPASTPATVSAGAMNFFGIANGITGIATTSTSYIRLEVYVQLSGSALTNGGTLTITSALVAGAAGAEAGANDTALAKTLRIVVIDLGGGASTTIDAASVNTLVTGVVAPHTDKFTYEALGAAGKYTMDSETNTVAISGGTLTSVTAVDEEEWEISLTAGVEYHKIAVYIWFEGQDVACTNVASNGIVSGDFSFSFAETVPQN